MKSQFKKLMVYSALAAWLLTVMDVVKADIVAGGPAYGGSGQTMVLCNIYNAGTGNVSINAKIIAMPNTIMTSAGSCGATLAAGSSCNIYNNVSNGNGYSCKVVVSPSGADVRGTLEFRDGTAATINAIELR